MSLARPLRDRLVLLGLACVPFLPSLGGGFVYDDVPLVQEDARVQSGDLRAALTKPYWDERHGGLFRPVTTASFVLEGMLSKEPWLFRLTNLALHGAATLLALGLARRLLPSSRAAFLAAAVFAVHPIHVEVAANVVGRAESLAFVLVGAGWALLLDDTHRVRPRRLVGASLLMCLGVLAKESAVALALAAPLEVFLLAPRPRRRQLALAALPAVVALALALAARVAALGPDKLLPSTSGIHSLMNPLALAAPLVRLANVPVLFLHYVRNLVFPVALSPDYGGATLPLVETPLCWATLGWTLAAGAVLLAPILLGGRRAAFGVLYCGLALLPVLQLVPIGTLAADRLAYAACFGFALLLGLGLDAAGARFERAGRAGVVALLGSFALLSGLDAYVWSDSLRLFERARERTPQSFAVQYALGELYIQRGENAGAVEALEAAHALAPADGNVLQLLGQAERELGHTEKARQHFQHALELGAEGQANVRLQLALVLVQLGALAGAQRELGVVTTLTPEDGDALYLLGQVEHELGHAEPARDLIERALALGVKDPAKGRVQLGLLLQDLGDLAGAERELRRATELEPAEARWFLALGQVLRARHDLPGARAAFERCIELDPGHSRTSEVRRWLASMPP